MLVMFATAVDTSETNLALSHLDQVRLISSRKADIGHTLNPKPQTRKKPMTSGLRGLDVRRPPCAVKEGP